MLERHLLRAASLVGRGDARHRKRPRAAHCASRLPPACAAPLLMGRPARGAHTVGRACWRHPRGRAVRVPHRYLCPAVQDARCATATLTGQQSFGRGSHAGGEDADRTGGPLIALVNSARDAGVRSARRPACTVLHAYRIAAPVASVYNASWMGPWSPCMRSEGEVQAAANTNTEHGQGRSMCSLGVRRSRDVGAAVRDMWARHVGTPQHSVVRRGCTGRAQGQAAGAEIATR